MTPSPTVASPQPPRPGHGGGDSIITNSIGMKLVLIPAGEFLMGSPDSDKDASDEEKPQHRVRITRPFYLGATEVTAGQFRRFVEQTGYRTEAERDGTGGWGRNEAKQKWEHDPKYTWRNPGFAQTDDHPVVLVSWNDYKKSPGADPLSSSQATSRVFRGASSLLPAGRVGVPLWVVAPHRSFNVGFRLTRVQTPR